jgi:hypothetical protein
MGKTSRCAILSWDKCPTEKMGKTAKLKQKLGGDIVLPSKSPHYD